MTRRPPRKTISQAELQALTKKKTLRRKFRNTPSYYDDVRYDSIAEAARAEELDQLLTAGEIAWWIGQPTVRLGCGLNKYRPDFLVQPNPGDFEADGTRAWFEDVKGGPWSVRFKKNVALWRRYGRAELRVIREGKTIARIFPDSWPETSWFPGGEVVE